MISVSSIYASTFGCTITPCVPCGRATYIISFVLPAFASDAFGFLVPSCLQFFLPFSSLLFFSSVYVKSDSPSLPLDFTSDVFKIWSGFSPHTWFTHPPPHWNTVLLLFFMTYAASCLIVPLTPWRLHSRIRRRIGSIPPLQRCPPVCKQRRIP